MKKRGMHGVVSLLMLTFSGYAHAGCPNTCEAVAGKANVEPALDCATFTPLVQDCSCALFIKVHNGCSSELVANDFSMTCAGSPGCTSLPADKDATITLVVNATGHKDWSLSFNEGESGDHALSLSLDVSEYDEPSDCSFRPRPRGNGGFAVAFTLAAAAAWASRRTGLRRRSASEAACGSSALLAGSVALRGLTSHAK